MATKLIKADLLKKVNEQLNITLPDDALTYERSGTPGWYYTHAGNTHYLGRNLAEAYEAANGLISIHPSQIGNRFQDNTDGTITKLPFSYPAKVENTGLKATEGQIPQPVQQQQANAACARQDDVIIPTAPRPQVPPQRTAQVINLNNYRATHPKKVLDMAPHSNDKEVPQLVLQSVPQSVPQSIFNEGLRNQTDTTLIISNEEIKPQHNDWLTPNSLADLVGITVRAANKLLAGAYNLKKPWRGAQLQVRAIEGNRGGNAGTSYEVYAPTLPQDLAHQWYAQFTAPEPDMPAVHLPVPLQVATHVALAGHDQTRQQRLAAIVKSITIYERHTNLRAQAVKYAMQKYGVTKDTVYRWIKAYEHGGDTALARKSRSDAGKDRVIVTQKWDKAMCGLLTDKQLQDAGTELTKYIRSLWRSGGTGYVTIATYATAHLIEYTQGLGVNFDALYLREICQVSRARVDAEKSYALLHIHETDKKRFHDDFVPTIQRHKDDLFPMDIVFGDVHPSDTPVRRYDGSIAYPRFIAWHDLATNRLWLTLKLCEKRENVTQVDIGQSYCSMVSQWGIPQTLYLDNGSEYKWDEMLASITHLNQLIRQQEDSQAHGRIKVFVDRPPIMRASPYEAQVKSIEGMFSVLEQKYFAMLPGYTGGNRMRKKTQNIGKEPEPYPNTWEQFHADIETMLATYHATPQKNLGNRSPNAVLQDYLDSGWPGVWQVPEQSLLLAFAHHDNRKIGAERPGCAKYESQYYYHDELLKYTGQRLPVAYPRHDPRYLFIFPPKGTVICAPLDVRFPFIDEHRTGAVEKQRRKVQLMRVISDKKKHCDRLDLIQVSADWANTQPATPDVPTIAQIEVNDTIKEMVAALETAQTNPAPQTTAPILNQWSQPNEGPLNIEWADED